MGFLIKSIFKKHKNSTGEFSIHKSRRFFFFECPPNIFRFTRLACRFSSHVQSGGTNIGKYLGRFNHQRSELKKSVRNINGAVQCNFLKLSDLMCPSFFMTQTMPSKEQWEQRTMCDYVDQHRRFQWKEEETFECTKCSSNLNNLKNACLEPAFQLSC